MTDNLTPEDRRRNMRHIRSTGTAAERRLGKLLREVFAGENVEEHPADLPGRPDFWIPALHMAVFADGCFFHGCLEHYQVPDKGRDYWEPKIARNRARDREANRVLRTRGIRPVRIWEHDLPGGLKYVRRRIVRTAREQRRRVNNVSEE